jgi:hypothetical protein
MAKRIVKGALGSESERGSVKMTILTPVQIPWNSKKGVMLELRKGGDLLGRIQITGAQVSVARKNKQTWYAYPFEQFIDKLSEPED